MQKYSVDFHTRSKVIAPIFRSLFTLVFCITLVLGNSLDPLQIGNSSINSEEPMFIEPINGPTNDPSIRSNFEEIRSHTSHVVYTAHPVISIEGNDAFNSTNGVVSGSGTAADPYLISGWEINDPTATYGIYVRNTTKFFEIRNCQITAGQYGIYLQFVDNYILSDIIISDMVSNDSADATESENAVISKYVTGIYMQICSNFTLSDIMIKNLHSGNGGNGYSTNSSILRRRGSSSGSVTGLNVMQCDDGYGSLMNFHIENLTTGNGGVGAVGPNAETDSSNGYSGGSGGSSGSIHVIKMSNCNLNISDGYIDTLSTGNGADGGDGGDSGTTSGDGGNGGDAGTAGKIYGIKYDNAENCYIQNIEIEKIRPGEGGDGGNGGICNNVGGISGDGGDGKDSGSIYGIYAHSIENMHFSSIRIKDGEIKNFGYGGLNGFTDGSLGSDGIAGNFGKIYGMFMSQCIDIFCTLISTEEINLRYYYSQINCYGFYISFTRDIQINLCGFECTDNYVVNSIGVSLTYENYGNYYSCFTAQDQDPINGICDSMYTVGPVNSTDRQPLALPIYADTDADGLLNYEEYQAHLNPYLPDNDFDGISDYDEIQMGTNPLIPDNLSEDSSEDDTTEDETTDEGTTDDTEDSNADEHNTDENSNEESGFSDFIESYGTLTGLGVVGVLIVVMGIVTKKN